MFFYSVSVTLAFNWHWNQSQLWQEITRTAEFLRNMTETGPKIVESKEDGKEGQAVTCQLLPGGFAGTGTVSNWQIFSMISHHMA